MRWGEWPSLSVGDKLWEAGTSKTSNWYQGEKKKREKTQYLPVSPPHMPSHSKFFRRFLSLGDKIWKTLNTLTIYSWKDAVGEEWHMLITGFFLVDLTNCLCSPAMCDFLGQCPNNPFITGKCEKLLLVSRAFPVPMHWKGERGDVSPTLRWAKSPKISTVLPGTSWRPKVKGRALTFLQFKLRSDSAS